MKSGERKLQLPDFFRDQIFESLPLRSDGFCLQDLLQLLDYPNRSKVNKETAIAICNTVKSAIRHGWLYNFPYTWIPPGKTAADAVLVVEMIQQHQSTLKIEKLETLEAAIQRFNLQLVEGEIFLPELSPIAVSPNLSETLTENLPLASVGSEKARSELLISPVLVAVRRLCDRQISLFSGAEFTVDEALGLSGVCDFLLSRSPEIIEIEAPVVVIVEATKSDLTVGFGHCIAEMVAAQRFNQTEPNFSSNSNLELSQNSSQNLEQRRIFGCITNGVSWRFLQLQNTTVTIDLIDYPLFPTGQILAILKWMVETAWA